MFDDIRPYQDSEIPAAMQRIISDKYFPLAAGFIFPEKPVLQVAALLASCRTAEEFQMRVMYDAIYSIANKTTGGLSVEGMERLNPGTNYLFISNHRDIMMDAAFLQVLLVDAGRKTSEITFGANLMHGQMVIDIGKSNKMFRIERPSTVTSPRDFLMKSRYVSEYIHHALTAKHESVWIAQRNGRTKNGLDYTDQGVVKMLGLWGGKDKVDALESLNICPLAISYEWEPCDLLKAIELYAGLSGLPYVKKPGEDLNSILTGVKQKKGRVHLTVTEPLRSEELQNLGGLSSSAFNRAVASLIDSRIRPAYRLWPNNYIAKDILDGKRSHSYTTGELKTFKDHIASLTQDYPHELKEILIKIYAGPLL